MKGQCSLIRAGFLKEFLDTREQGFGMMTLLQGIAFHMSDKKALVGDGEKNIMVKKYYG